MPRAEAAFQMPCAEAQKEIRCALRVKNKESCLEINRAYWSQKFEKQNKIQKQIKFEFDRPSTCFPRIVLAFVLAALGAR